MNHDRGRYARVPVIWRRHVERRVKLPQAVVGAVRAFQRGLVACADVAQQGGDVRVDAPHRHAARRVLHLEAHVGRAVYQVKSAGHDHMRDADRRARGIGLRLGDGHVEQAGVRRARHARALPYTTGAEADRLGLERADRADAAGAGWVGAAQARCADRVVAHVLAAARAATGRAHGGSTHTGGATCPGRVGIRGRGNLEVVHAVRAASHHGGAVGANGRIVSQAEVDRRLVVQRGYGGERDREVVIRVVRRGIPRPRGIHVRQDGVRRAGRGKRGAVGAVLKHELPGPRIAAGLIPVKRHARVAERSALELVVVADSPRVRAERRRRPVARGVAVRARTNMVTERSRRARELIVHARFRRERAGRQGQARLKRP